MDYPVKKMIFKTFLYWLVSAISLTTFVYFQWGRLDALSCVIGEVLVGFNLLVLIWAWRRIFERKGLALAAGVIVLKYAILISSMHWLIGQKIVSAFGFLIGCGVLLIVLMLLSYDYSKQNKIESQIDK